MRTSNTTMVHRLCLFGMLLAAAVLVSYIESMIPMPGFFYGFKLGLVNAVLLLVLYLWGFSAALLISALRVLIIGFLFGNPISMLYSLAGGIVSLLLMAILKKTRLFSITGVSIAGGISHNLAQLLVAIRMLHLNRANILFYLPLLLITGLVTGALIGLFTGVLKPHLSPLFSATRKTNK